MATNGGTQSRTSSRVTSNTVPLQREQREKRQVLLKLRARQGIARVKAGGRYLFDLEAVQQALASRAADGDKGVAHAE